MQLFEQFLILGPCIDKSCPGDTECVVSVDGEPKCECTGDYNVHDVIFDKCCKWFTGSQVCALESLWAY